MTWVTGIILAPVLNLVDPAVSEFLYYFYSPVCHQFPQRSFFLAGYPLAVCVRCLSFYSAGLLLISYYMLRNRTGWWNSVVYVVLITPSIFDFIAEKIGLYSNLDIIRFFTGALLGLACFHMIIIGISTRLNWDRKMV